MKNKILEIALKVLIVFYITLLGIFALTSCSVSRSMEGSGKTTIVITDTTYVKHNGFIRSKKYLPYVE